MRNEPEEINNEKKTRKTLYTWFKGKTMMNKDTNMDMKIVNIAKAESAAFIDDEKSWQKLALLRGYWLVFFLTAVKIHAS